jgi:hypothetical protein
MERRYAGEHVALLLLIQAIFLTLPGVRRLRGLPFVHGGYRIRPRVSRYSLHSAASVPIK